MSKSFRNDAKMDPQISDFQIFSQKADFAKTRVFSRKNVDFEGFKGPKFD